MSCAPKTLNFDDDYGVRLLYKQIFLLPVIIYYEILHTNIECINVVFREPRCLHEEEQQPGTVSSIPLQTASIVSKKIAEGPDSLILDVKYSRAAFQETVEDTHELAKIMIHMAHANGIQPTCAFFLMRMDHPIGCNIGNWLEVYKSVELLKTGKGAKLVIDLGHATVGLVVMCVPSPISRRQYKRKRRRGRQQPGQR